jgi:RNA dependent RNA polymerase
MCGVAVCSAVQCRIVACPVVWCRDYQPNLLFFQLYPPYLSLSLYPPHLSLTTFLYLSLPLYLSLSGMRLGLLVSRTYTGLDRTCIISNTKPGAISSVPLTTGDGCRGVNSENKNSSSSSSSNSRSRSDARKKSGTNHISSSSSNSSSSSSDDISTRRKTEKNKEYKNINRKIDSIEIRWMDDIYHKNHPVDPAGISRNPFCLTDGSGFISLDLAAQLPVCVSQGIVTEESSWVRYLGSDSRDFHCSDFDFDSSKSESQVKTLHLNNASKNEKGYISETKMKIEEKKVKMENKETRKKQNSKIPSAFQVRIICPIGVFKGTLVVDRKLPEGTIVVRPSMLKANPAVGRGKGYSDNERENVTIDETVDKRILFPLPSTSTPICTTTPLSTFSTSISTSSPRLSSICVEVVNTSRPLNRFQCCLNKHLILLLHCRGVPLCVFDERLR